MINGQSLLRSDVATENIIATYRGFFASVLLDGRFVGRAGSKRMGHLPGPPSAMAIARPRQTNTTKHGKGEEGFKGRACLHSDGGLFVSTILVNDRESSYPHACGGLVHRPHVWQSQTLGKSEARFGQIRPANMEETHSALRCSASRATGAACSQG